MSAAHLGEKLVVKSERPREDAIPRDAELSVGVHGVRARRRAWCARAEFEDVVECVWAVECAWAVECEWAVKCEWAVECEWAVDGGRRVIIPGGQAAAAEVCREAKQ